MKHFTLHTRSLALIASLVALAACDGGAAVEMAVGPTGDLTAAGPLPTVAPIPTEDIAVQTAAPVQPAPELIESIRGDVQPLAQSIFGLTGQAGDVVRIEVQVRSGAPDLALELSTPGGEVLARVDAGGPGESEAVGEFRFPATGYYELGVRSAAGDGQIDVLIYQLADEVLSGGGVIPGFDQPATGSMDSPATIHSFTLQVERGQRFDLRATALSGDLDLLFELYDPQGEAVASRDDSLGYDPYLFNHMPVIGGEYTVVLTNYEQTTGDYELLAQRSQSSGQLSFGRNQTIALPTEPHHGTWMTFVGVGGEGLSIDAEPISPNVDLTLAIHDIHGNRLAFADLGGPGVGEHLRVRRPYDGPYQLAFDTLLEGGQMRYDVIARTPLDFDPNGSQLAFPTTRKVTIESREVGVTYAYWFDGEAGQRVTFDGSTNAGTLDLAFDLYDQAGNLLSTHDDDRGNDPVLENYPLPFTGRYYLVLRIDAAHRGGEFRLRAEMPPPPDQAGSG
jgi:hypothetical protein